MLTIDFDRLSIKPGYKILDLGCGEGRHALNAYLLYQDVEIYGVDLSEKDINTCYQRFDDIQAFAETNEESNETQKNSSNNNVCTFITGDAFQLPFEAHTFDIIICSEVLEHIHEYEKVLSEIRRTLKTDGQLAISVPRKWPEKICWALSSAYHNVEGGHIRIFNAKQLQKEIEASGFSYRQRHWAHALHVPYWWLRCLFWARGETFLLVKLYHKLLVWDLMKKPWITTRLERLLNPLMGKSVVMYFNNKG